VSTTIQAASVTIDDIRAAARGLSGLGMRTPVIDVPGLAARAGVPVGLKCEHLQVTGAFKVRGAYTAVSRVAREGGGRGVVTQSSGNHGQAVAWAARRFGLREVVFAGAIRSPEQVTRAEAIAREEGLVLIPPFDHPDVVAGQGTCGLEILEQRPDVGTILVPVSGGGLLAGICVAVAALRPEVRVVAVEPAGAAKLTAALAAGAPRVLERTESMADGLLTRSIGVFTFPLLRSVVREVVRVSEDEIAGAVRFLHREAGLTAEPSGAVATASLLAGRVQPAGPVVAVVTGGNIDPELFQRLVG
jgi:threonine dehydratase